jgi:hypothetical protein
MLIKHCPAIVAFPQAQPPSAILQHLVADLVRLSCGYGTLLMLLEAPGQLQAALGPQAYSLHAWAKQAGVRLQLVWSGGPSETQVGPGCRVEGYGALD